MQFVATLEHTPDNCWAHEEKEEMAREWLGRIRERAGEHGVELQGSYVSPNEHTFYFVIEADSFADVTGFLGPPLLQDHDADVAPVLPLGEVESAVFED